MTTLDVSGQTVLVIRSLWEQVPLIEAANRCGARTVAIDEDSDAEGLTVADDPLVVDSLRDADACLDAVAEFDIDAVVTDECDYSLFTASYIGTRLGIPAVDLAAAQMTTHKGRLRNRLAGQTPQPSFATCTTLSGVRDAADEIGYPLIVKPVDSRGAFGVTRVSEDAGLKNAYLDALVNSHAREVITERFVEGTPITVEGYYRDGEHRTLLIGSKDTPLGNLDPDREIVYPATLDDEIKKNVVDINDRIASHIDSGFGATHAEYVVSEDGVCYLLEFHNRGGGIHISAKIVREVTGFDINKQLLADAVGAQLTQEQISRNRAVAVVHPLRLPAGTLRDLRGVRAVRDNPSVLTLQPYVEPDDEIEESTSPVNSHGLLITKGETKTAARNVIDAVYNTLTPVYASEDGNSR
jgi:biotin carboxylase